MHTRFNERWKNSTQETAEGRSVLFTQIEDENDISHAVKAKFTTRSDTGPKSTLGRSLRRPPSEQAEKVIVRRIRSEPGDHA